MARHRIFARFEKDSVKGTFSGRVEMTGLAVEVTFEELADCIEESVSQHPSSVEWNAYHQVARLVLRPGLTQRLVQ